MADDPPRPWVLMFSGSPWQLQAHRQHALARELASGEQGYRVLFVDPPTNGVRWTWSIRRLDGRMWHARLPSLLPMGRQLNLANRASRWWGSLLVRRWLRQRPGCRVLWIDEDLAAPVVGQLDETAVVYDATDLDWTFTRPWNRGRLRRSLMDAATAADAVLASSSVLRDHLPDSVAEPVLVANGCDPSEFTPDGPVDVAIASLPRPIIGYLGSIDERALDAPLVATLAHRHPEWTFVLVGPSTSGGRAPLDGLPNVHLMAPVPFERAPEVVRAFDVAVIPYRLGELIDYVHPKKCFEYLAAGKPVVSTALPALTDLAETIGLASGTDQFEEAVVAALGEVSPEAVAMRRSVAAANSWAVRGALVRSVVAELVT